MQEALVQQIGRNLVSHCARSLDKHFVGYSRSLRREDGHPNRGEDVEVVRLPWQECLSIEAHRRELDSSGIDSLALGPCISLLGCALGMFGRVREREDHGTLVDAGHRLDDFLSERAAHGADADNRSRLDTLDRSDKVPSWCVLVCIRVLEI